MFTQEDFYLATKRCSTHESNKTSNHIEIKSLLLIQKQKQKCGFGTFELVGERIQPNSTCVLWISLRRNRNQLNSNQHYSPVSVFRSLTNARVFYTEIQRQISKPQKQSEKHTENHNKHSILAFF